MVSIIGEQTTNNRSYTTVSLSLTHGQSRGSWYLVAQPFMDPTSCSKKAAWARGAAVTCFLMTGKPAHIHQLHPLRSNSLPVASANKTKQELPKKPSSAPKLMTTKVIKFNLGLIDSRCELNRVYWFSHSVTQSHLTECNRKKGISHSANHWQPHKDLWLLKRNETGSFVETWMDLETVIQSEVSQKDKNKYRILTHICGI